MKVNHLDAHDRYLEFLHKPHSQDIGECCQDLINKKPFGDHPFYIFAHARTEPDGATKRIIWQPRLTKPKAQTNSMLFRAYPMTDVIKILWMIPAPELWDNFESGKMTQNKIVAESIFDFKHNRSALEANEEDDLTDEQIDNIYREISLSVKK